MKRRDLLIGAGALCGTGTGWTSSSLAQTVPAPVDVLRRAQLRGALDATQLGVRPDASDDQSVFLQKVLDKASEENKPVYLPPGRYLVANINLPSRTRLMGLAGTAHLVYGGGGAMLSATGCEQLAIDGISVDGGNRTIDEEYGGLLYLRACPDLRITDCKIAGSLASAISLDTCGGRISGCDISGAAGIAGLFSVNATGLTINDNRVSDCANGGILVHRWEVGKDNTVVSNNRIERIQARGGGTGQRGNGINMFRANGVMVANNHITGSAFSAIRANSASNANITGNTALNSGETAIYAEFSFEGSVISNNIVDGATMGISIANFNEGGRLAVCSNNLIRNLKREAPYPQEVQEFGIGIGVEADTLVLGNVIENAPVAGLTLGWGSFLRNVVASQNIVRQCGLGIAVTVVDGAQRAVIDGNLMQGCERGGIIGHDHTKAVTSELVGSKPNTHAHLTIRHNTLI